MEIIFENPNYLFFLLSLPVLIIFHYVTLRKVKGRVLQFANFIAMSRISGPHNQPRNILQLFIRLLTLVLIIFAVSGMSIKYMGDGVKSDYVLAIDISSSMSSTDILPSRLDAAKIAAVDFISSVPDGTKIGLVSFSGTSFIEQQLTDDKLLLINKTNDLDTKIIGGTDLGEAIISSSNLLVSSDNAKTIILLTDGSSNIGVDVSVAVGYANRNNVQVFTIGVGTKEGGAPAGLNISLKLDDEILKMIADLTNGEYIFAENREEVINAYNDILVKTKRKKSLDLTITLMFLTLLASFIDWMLVNTIYRRIA